MSAEAQIQPPLGPPDCPWRPMSANTSVPGTAVYQDAKMNGDEVYIGRVYDGSNLYIGTAVPRKGICIYLDKNSELKSSPNYEILTVDCGNPLCFQDMDLENKNIFVAGIDETEELLYIGRIVDGDNTYYGWTSKSSKSVYIPRDSSVGPQVLDKDFGVMIHKFLDRLCICPPCPSFCSPSPPFCPPKTA